MGAANERSGKPCEILSPWMRASQGGRRTVMGKEEDEQRHMGDDEKDHCWLARAWPWLNVRFERLSWARPREYGWPALACPQRPHRQPNRLILAP